jgi:excisionase family DNA binding protein
MSSPKTHALRNREPLGSIPEVAAYVNVANITIRRRINRGQLPATKIGGQIRIRWSDVDALLAHGTIAPTA